jgi:hypothetical protein
MVNQKAMTIARRERRFWAISAIVIILWLSAAYVIERTPPLEATKNNIQEMF